MVLRGAGSSSKLGRAANVMIARMVIAIARTSLKIDPSGVRAMSPSWRQIELGVLLSSRAIEREAVREITLWLNRENLSRSTKSSSRNVRHEQPVRNSLLEILEHAGLASGHASARRS